MLEGSQTGKTGSRNTSPNRKASLDPPFDKDAIKSMLTENVQESGSAAGCIRD